MIVSLAWVLINSFLTLPYFIFQRYIYFQFIYFVGKSPHTYRGHSQKCYYGHIPAATLRSINQYMSSRCNNSGLLHVSLRFRPIRSDKHRTSLYTFGKTVIKKKRRRPVTTTFSRCTCWQNATLSIEELRGCSATFPTNIFSSQEGHRHPALIVRKKWICARRKEKVSNQESLCNVY